LQNWPSKDIFPRGGGNIEVLLTLFRLMMMQQARSQIFTL